MVSSRHHRQTLLFAALAMALLPTAARSAAGAEAPQVADGEAPQIAALAASDAPPPKTWYGWQVLAFDLPITAIQAVTFHSSPLLFIGSYPAFFLGAPIIHAVHGHPGWAGLSLALHVGLPVLGATLGCAAGTRHGGPLDGTCDEMWFRSGQAVGDLLAAALDAGLLSYDDAPSNGRSVAAAPTFSAGANGFVVGWAARF